VRMTRDLRRGLSAIVLHTIMKNGMTCPHEMIMHHGVGSDERRSQWNSIIHDNENLV
jgi:hypothetical protein